MDLQLSGYQALKGTDMFHKVWGFVMGGLNGFNTQIYTFSSNYKGRIHVMFCSVLVLIPVVRQIYCSCQDRFAIEVNTSGWCLKEKRSWCLML